MTKPVTAWVKAWMQANNLGRVDAIIAYLDEQAAAGRSEVVQRLEGLTARVLAATEASRAPASPPAEDKPVFEMPEWSKALREMSEATLAVQRERDEAQAELTETQTLLINATNQLDEAQAELTRVRTEVQQLYAAFGPQNIANPREARQHVENLRQEGSEDALTSLARELADANGELTRVKAENARLREDDAAQRKLAAVLGMENIPDTGPTWPASWDALIARVTQLIESERESATLREALEVTAVVAREQVAGLKSELVSMQAGSLRDHQRLAKQSAELEELKSELTWERGWDLFRKARMGAVVEIARRFMSKDSSGADSLRALRELDTALSALDTPTPGPTGEREPSKAAVYYWVLEYIRASGAPSYATAQSRLFCGPETYDITEAARFASRLDAENYASTRFDGKSLVAREHADVPPHTPESEKP